MTGTTTIRLTQSGKRALERVRANLQRFSDHKVTQQEAAEVAFKTAARELSSARNDEWKPTQAQKDFMLSFVGIASDPDLQSSQIDDELYGRRE